MIGEWFHAKLRKHLTLKILCYKNVASYAYQYVFFTDDCSNIHKTREADFNYNIKHNVLQDHRNLENSYCFFNEKNSFSNFMSKN